MLNSINNNFNVFGVSGMNSMLSSSLLRGRPFGGVAFLWHKCLVSHISYVGSDVDGRCMAIRLTINCRVIILFTVYFPCLSSKASYKTDLSQCLGFSDSVISVNSGSDVVIMGDMNFTYSNDNLWVINV